METKETKNTLAFIHVHNHQYHQVIFTFCQINSATQQNERERERWSVNDRVQCVIRSRALPHSRA